uniref:MtnX-like HAD-IB family phosphatase n=1 Tax=Alcaligenes faecalis TaxID=511 RepID=UPI003CFD9910
MNEMLLNYKSAMQTGQWRIQCDFDGTISLQDVADTLLNRHGMPGWQELEEAWERGEIGSHDCMCGQVALLDMSVAELHSCLDEVGIDPFFAQFVAVTKRLGVPLQIVSDGLDYAIHYLLGREGLRGLPVLANCLEVQGPRRWRLDTPWHRLDCASANCKCGHLSQAHAQSQRVLYIGDGSSDFCVAAKADFVLAKGRLQDYCQERGIAHAPFEGFSQAIALLPSLLHTPDLRSMV